MGGLPTSCRSTPQASVAGQGCGNFSSISKRVHKYIAFGMKLRRLLYPFHRLDFRQHLAQQTSFIEQFECALGVAFGQHAREFVAYPFARNLVNLRGKFLNRRECRGFNRVFKPRGEAHSPQHAQLVFRKANIGISDGPNDSRL